MAEPWGEQISGSMPAVAGVDVDVIVTPDLEYPQPLTVQFDRDVSDVTGNCAMQAELRYRCGNFVRVVRCDWRGMATVLAQQLTVRAVSVQPGQPLFGAYSAGGTHKHSAQVGIGAVPHQPAELSEGQYVILDPPGDETITITVPKLARRLRIRVTRAISPSYTTFGECYADALLAGQSVIQLCHARVDNIVHSQPLLPEHIEHGIELGNADYVLFTGPHFMGPDILVLELEWVLAL